MALIKCPECGREISDKASTCLGCGAPVSASSTTTSAQPAKRAFFRVRINGKESGPYSMGELQSLWSNGQITRETQFAGRGSDNWQPIETIFQQIMEYKPPLAAESNASQSSAQPGLGTFAQPMVVKSTGSRGVFIILGLFFGCLGVHNFYAGFYGKGAVQLIITVFAWVALWPAVIVTAVWALVEICTVREDASGDPLT